MIKPYEQVKNMEQNTCLKCFINKVWAVMKANMYKKKIQDVDELQECVVED